MSAAHSSSAKLNAAGATRQLLSNGAAARAQDDASVLGRIGNTPLLSLEALTQDLPAVRLFGKAEWYNPGGSVKDRAAAGIVNAARRDGKLAPGKILLDSTSGNTGIAYAMLGAALGFPVTLCVPENVSVERKRILQAYGANIIFTDPGEGSDGAIKIARQLTERHPELYFYADQYSNDANWRAHYLTTANEIWEQTEGRVTHFVSMLGTTGTFVGTTRRLKELN
ncbi:MAG: pyridoxal-phosphate dependent enzyme, partial [Terriglobales bacterium]